MILSMDSQPERWAEKVIRLTKDTLMECDQMRFIFQHNPPCNPDTLTIGVAVLGSH